MKISPHQKAAVKQLSKILLSEGVAYLAGEIRTGKTLTALTVINEVSQPFSATAWIAPKKSHPSIKKDAASLGVPVDLFNLESLHKRVKVYDVVVVDEAHKVGRFPKPGTYARELRKMITEGNAWVLLLSGTPSPESYSQLFHQFWVTGKGPWKLFPNFYRWADRYVNVKQKYIGMGKLSNDYSEGKTNILEDFDRFKVTMTQEAAGIEGKVEEHFHILKTPAHITKVLHALKKNGMTTFKNFESPYSEITALTMSKMNILYHQLCSGTVIDDDKNPLLISNFKAKFIKHEFAKKKIAIYYVYQREGDLLRSMFSNYTDSPEFFNGRTDAVFVCQIKAGKEGVDLSTADALVIFNLNFSAVDYYQVRGRLQNIKRKATCPMHFIFSDTGFEKAIYDIVVRGKARFTTDHFKEYIGEAYVKEVRSAIKETSRQMSKPHGFKKRLQK